MQLAITERFLQVLYMGGIVSVLQLFYAILMYKYDV